MAKVQSEFICQSCGAKSAAFLGRCPVCGEWGSYVETPITGGSEDKLTTKEQAALTELSKIQPKLVKRIPTGIGEVDRVLGGGIVPASVILIAGEPGIGKSTILTQIAAKMALNKFKVIYVTGEESPEQISLRADRIFKTKLNNFWVAAETDIEKIANTLISQKPNIVICDSIQTMTLRGMTGTAGSVGQVRECAQILHRAAKINNFSLILVGHITKEGVVAGPKVLEHLVDVVLHFEGDAGHQFRILRSSKNRFGTISEVGVFEMGQDGLAEVENPSKFFLSNRSSGITGSAILATISGTRAILAEIQALATPSTFVQPRRVVNGLEFSRVMQILAVLTKIFKIPVNNSDLYISVAGGLEISETAADLPTALAVLSVFWGKPVNKIAAGAAEIGLLGELRQVPQLERRRREAAKFGFSKFLEPSLGNLEKAAKVAFTQ